MNGNDSEAAFQTYLEVAFLHAKCTRIALIRTSLAQKIVDCLKARRRTTRLLVTSSRRVAYSYLIYLL